MKRIILLAILSIFIFSTFLLHYSVSSTLKANICKKECIRVNGLWNNQFAEGEEVFTTPHICRCEKVNGKIIWSDLK